MASCTRIENSLQAQIDGELGDAERVILEQHVAECPRCAQLLRDHQWLSALLFESFSVDRLTHPIRQAVLDRLPEMEVPPPEIEDLNWRAKHPNKWTRRMAHVVPVAAVVILVFLTIVLRFSYPEDPSQPDPGIYPPERPAVGVVTQRHGEPTRIAVEETRRMPAALTTLARPGDRFETGAGTQMMLSLAGPTLVKLNENTRLKVSDARRLTVESGTIWLDVAHDGSLFKVLTPAGMVTVFGTIFSVKVDGDRMTVTVESGHVQVESGEHLYQLHDNQQVMVSASEAPVGPREVNASEVHRWADAIQPDQTAQAFFEEVVGESVNSEELPGRIAFVIDTLQDGHTSEVDAIRIYWDTKNLPANGASYDVTVSDGSGHVLRQARLTADLIRSRKDGYFDVILDEPIRQVRTLVVRLIPDLKSGLEEIDSFEVKARTRVEQLNLQ